MAIKIVTLAEAELTKKRCEQYGECFEAIYGKAKASCLCDNSGMEILRGQDCACVLVLPGKDHPNYEHQKAMLADYVYTEEE